jgi:protein CpxP
MKAGTVRRLTLVAAGIFAAVTTMGAQGFGGGQGQKPGMAGNRPPMERAFGPMANGWWNNPRIVERLKLTDDQRKAMDQILLEHREKLIDLRANLQKAELAMEPLMGADTPNDSAILAQTDKIVQARGELEKANARFLLAIRDKLTADQWKQIEDFRRNGGMQRWRDGDRRPGGQEPGGQFHRQGPPPQGQQPPPPPPNPGNGSGSGMEQ